MGWEYALEEEMATHSSILPGKSHGQRSLVDYSHGVIKSQTQLCDRAQTHTQVPLPSNSSMTILVNLSAII